MIVFGPVPSRRLGKSLGINNIFGPKVCSYNCVYCQVGATFRHQAYPDIFFEPSVIVNEVRSHLSKLPVSDFPDYLTFVSNGEPTLDINLGKSILKLKQFGIPVAVITNGSLLSDPSVRASLNEADWVSVKVDAPDSETWRNINRPVSGLDFARYLEFLSVFAGGFGKILCTETMLLKGVNDSSGKIGDLARGIKKINPSRAYLSVPSRPPAVATVEPAEPDKINEAFRIFVEKGINVLLLVDMEGYNIGSTGNVYEDLLNILAVHPLREEQLRSLLVSDDADVSVVDFLLRQKMIRMVRYRGEIFYKRNFPI